MAGQIFLFFFIAWGSTVSIMSAFVEKERVAGERRMDALFLKKTEVLCPGYSQKGMSLCVRQYLKTAKIETAMGFNALTNFITIAANQDQNTKICDEETAQLLAVENLMDLQDQLKRENLLCSTLKPQGAQHLLEIKKICFQEAQNLQQAQEKNKKFIMKHIEKKPTSSKDELQVWKIKKREELKKKMETTFVKTLFKENDYKITPDDIVLQNKVTIASACQKLQSPYKERFSGETQCEEIFSQLLRSCVTPSLRDPTKVQAKEMSGIIQQPMSCFYTRMQEYLTKH